MPSPQTDQAMRAWFGWKASATRSAAPRKGLVRAVDEQQRAGDAHEYSAPARPRLAHAWPLCARILQRLPAHQPGKYDQADEGVALFV